VKEEDAGIHSFEVILSDDGPEPKFEADYSFSVSIDYTLMPQEEMSEYLEIQALEEGIQKALEGS
jgi:hypothetical protein